MRIVVRVGMVFMCSILHCPDMAHAAAPTVPQSALNPQSKHPDTAKDAAPKQKAPKKPRHSGKHASDAEITNKVRLALARARDIDSTDIDVETRAGIVRLSGEVENPKQVARVKQLAARVEGVKKIDSLLTARNE